MYLYEPSLVAYSTRSFKNFEETRQFTFFLLKECMSLTTSNSFVEACFHYFNNFKNMIE